MFKSNTFYVCVPTLESSFQVLLGRLGVVPEQCVHRHHHPRSTEAALKAMVLHQVTLERYTESTEAALKAMVLHQVTLER